MANERNDFANPNGDSVNTPATPDSSNPPMTLPEDGASVPPPVAAPPASSDNNASGADANTYDERLERLGGEPAPVITPDEFARLQKAGQVQIDARGRVRTTRRDDADGGVSLRKRRAWYC